MNNIYFERLTIIYRLASTQLEEIRIQLIVRLICYCVKVAFIDVVRYFGKLSKIQICFSNRQYIIKMPKKV